MSAALAKSDARLSPEELEDICGGLTQPRRQVNELRRQGFWRARFVSGECILERAHYNAVCAGAVEPSTETQDTARPSLTPWPTK